MTMASLCSLVPNTIISLFILQQKSILSRSTVIFSTSAKPCGHETRLSHMKRSGHIISPTPGSPWKRNKGKIDQQREDNVQYLFPYPAWRWRCHISNACVYRRLCKSVCYVYDKIKTRPDPRWRPEVARSSVASQTYVKSDLVRYICCAYILVFHACIHNGCYTLGSVPGALELTVNRDLDIDSPGCSSLRVMFHREG